MPSTSVLPDDVTHVALRLYEGLGSPVAKDLIQKIKSRDWDGISDVSPDPRTYTNAGAYSLTLPQLVAAEVSRAPYHCRPEPEGEGQVV